MSTLRLEGVGVAYGGTPAVSDVTLSVGAGEWVALIGPNGAGKSSLLRAVAGLVPSSGTVTVDGAPPARGRARARQIALVPQTPVVPPGLTVASYVLLGRTPHLGVLGSERPRDLAVVADVLRRLSLEHLAHRMLDTLSGGERQRTVVARALAQQTPVLLLDEPTSGLDVGSQQEVLELIARLCVEDELAVLSAMHDLTAAGQFADRLALVSDQHVAAVGMAREVLTARSIGQHYGARVRVLVDGDAVVVIPTRIPRTAPTPVIADEVAHIEEQP